MTAITFIIISFILSFYGGYKVGYNVGVLRTGSAIRLVGEKVYGPKFSKDIGQAMIDDINDDRIKNGKEPIKAEYVGSKK